MNIHRYIAISGVCLQRGWFVKPATRHLTGETGAIDPCYTMEGVPDVYPWVAYRKFRSAFAPSFMDVTDIIKTGPIQKLAQRWVS